MSFDVYLQFVEQSPPVDESSAERRFDEVVRSFGGEPADPPYTIVLADGSELECGIRGALSLRGMTAMQADFIYEVMAATQWTAVIPNVEDLVSLRALPRETLLEDVPEITVVSSKAEFVRLLRGGFSGWSAYRDQVLKDD